MGGDFDKNPRFPIIQGDDEKFGSRLIAELFPCEGKIDYSGVFECLQDSTLKVKNPVLDAERGYAYSVDKIRLAFTATATEEKVCDCIERSMSFDVLESYTSNKVGGYRYMWVFSYADCSNGGGVRKTDDGEIVDGSQDVKLSVGFRLNTGNGAKTGFVEWNPNKCNEERVSFLLRDMYACGVDFKLSRWDLAIDVPLDRRLVHVMKDNRKYELHMSNGMTEYLGRRNCAGRAKVYDKTAESGLKRLVTRVELTCEPTWGAPKIMEKLPRCVSYSDLQGVRADASLMALVTCLADVQESWAAARADLKPGDGENSNNCSQLGEFTLEKYLSILPKNTKYKVKKLLREAESRIEYSALNVDMVLGMVRKMVAQANGGM